MHTCQDSYVTNIEEHCVKVSFFSASLCWRIWTAFFVLLTIRGRVQVLMRSAESLSALSYNSAFVHSLSELELNAIGVLNVRSRSKSSY